MSTAVENEGSRPLRADAARNRVRIVQAASELFAERGLEVTLDDVAARAGVGVGTVYRRFANRDELVHGIFTEHFENIVRQIRTRALDADPWDAVVILITVMGEMMSTDRGLATMLVTVDHSDPALVASRERLEELITCVIERAKAAGAVRPDLELTDLFGILSMIAAVSKATQRVDGAWRRFAELILDGMRGGGLRVPLTTPALTEAEVQRLKQAASAC